MMLVHERMHFLRRICIWALPALPVAWLTAVWLAPWRLEPLSSSNTEGTGKLPPDAIVVHAEATTPCTAPMVLREAALTSLGTALTIPDGKGGGAGRGQATLSCTVDQPGNYRAWVRARWQDSCGNSVFFRVGDGRQRTIGQDSVYGRWHWVEAGNHELPPGAHKLAFVEREDGIAIDQVLLTRDKTFVPTGAISAGTEAIGTRIFADDFSRSPGHGLEAWRMPSGLWDIAFSLDPNRIPNQYSLVGRAPIGDSAPTAIALVSGAPWNGCRLAFSVRPELGSEFGAVLEHSGDGGDALRIGFALSGSTPSAQLTRPGLSVEAALHDALRPDQWHRVVAERWSSVLRVTLDGDIVFERTDIAPGNGDVGVWVAAGSVAFDDVHIEEIPWQEDDGKSQRLNWDVPAGARWYRPRRDGPVALVGRKGRLRTAATELPVYAVLVDDRGTDSCRLVTEGYVPLARSGGARLFRWADADSLPPAAVTLEPSGRSTEIARVAIRYGVPTAPVFRLGPYNFETDKIEDPSDYLDFTPEEYRRIAASPEADKLRRQRKYNALVGTDSSAVWRTRAGRWAVAGGVLRGSGPNARLAFWQEIAGDFDLLLRFRVADPGTIADLDLYGGPPDGLRVRIAVTEPPGDTVDSAVAVLAPRPNEWQSLIVRTRGGVARAHRGRRVAPGGRTPCWGRRGPDRRPQGTDRDGRYRIPHAAPPGRGRLLRVRPTRVRLVADGRVLGRPRRHRLCARLAMDLPRRPGEPRHALEQADVPARSHRRADGGRKHRVVRVGREPKSHASPRGQHLPAPRDSARRRERVPARGQCGESHSDCPLQGWEARGVGETGPLIPSPLRGWTRALLAATKPHLPDKKRGHAARLRQRPTGARLYRS